MKANDVYTQVTESIISKLECGVVPWRRTWAAPMNYCSRRPYSGINVWLLHGRYELPYWLTYRQARQMGGHVRRGEHGTRIIYWNMVDVTDGDDEVRQVPILRCYTVFNVAQCSGVEVPHIEPITSAEVIVDNYHDAPVLEVGSSASYNPTVDTMYLPHRDTFESAAAYYTTLYHEMTHSTGHESRLNRVMDTQYASESYSTEELIAELGAAYLCAISGIELAAQGLDNTTAYIQHWVGKLREDRKFIVRVSSTAQRAANWILGHPPPNGVRRPPLPE